MNWNERGKGADKRNSSSKWHQGGKEASSEDGWSKLEKTREKRESEGDMGEREEKKSSSIFDPNWDGGENRLKVFPAH